MNNIKNLGIFLAGVATGFITKEVVTVYLERKAFAEDQEAREFCEENDENDSVSDVAEESETIDSENINSACENYCKSCDKKITNGNGFDAMNENNDTSDSSFSSQESVGEEK